MVGIDEAGRGALAGPLVVASVHTEQPYDFGSVPIRDSKTLSESQREQVFEAVLKLNIPFQTSIIEVQEINKKGIGWANTSGIRDLISLARPGLATRLGISNQIIVDGYFPKRKISVKGMDIRCQVDADATVFPVILAGIVAKVTRDRIMRTLHKEYRDYGWAKNKGYGTRSHIRILREIGLCPYHRIQFVKTALRSS